VNSCEHECLCSETHDLCTVDNVKNVARYQRKSFYLPVTLWVYGKKVQVEALVDSGATSTFINKSVVREHHLVTEKLAQAYGVLNVDGTPNKAGQITKTVKAYLEIGEHKTKERMFVTDLGRKDMIIGYDQLHRHNPEIDWQTGEWRFTRCPESCVPRARKNIRVTQEEVVELETPETL
jgi:hypothetical protein